VQDLRKVNDITWVSTQDPRVSRHCLKWWPLILHREWCIIKMWTTDQLLPSVGPQFEILAQISRIVGVVKCTFKSWKGSQDRDFAIQESSIIISPILSTMWWKFEQSCWVRSYLYRDRESKLCTKMCLSENKRERDSAPHHPFSSTGLALRCLFGGISFTRPVL